MARSVTPAFDGPRDRRESQPHAVGLERRGRKWLIWSFLFCPCHLPLSLGVLGAVLAGTSAGALLRENAWLAGSIISAVWIIGTGYGFRLIRQAERTNGACPVPKRRRNR